VHRPRQLSDADRTVNERIPVTTVARTIFDLPYTVGATALESAFRTAARRDLLDFSSLDALIRRGKGRRGVGQLSSLVAEYRPVPENASDLEDRFLHLCRQHGLPMPAVDVVVAGYEADMYWRKAGLIVELDGWEFHKDRAAFEQDRARDAAHLLAGIRVIRVTSRQLDKSEEDVFRAIASLLRTGPKVPGYSGRIRPSDQATPID
jgi:very-short-patch-repair endonuclease